MARVKRAVHSKKHRRATLDRAKGYFGKKASELTFSESAMLCGLLRSPDRLSPWRNYSACIEERNRVLNRLLELNRVRYSALTPASCATRFHLRTSERRRSAKY